MAIARLVKVSFLAPASDRTAVLEELQRRGCFEPIQGDGRPWQVPAANAAGTQEALRFLARAPYQCQASAMTGDAQAALAEVRALRERTRELEEAQAALARAVRDTAAWGEWDPAAAGALADAGLRLWFYRLAPAQLAPLAASDAVWLDLGGGGGMRHVVVLASEPPAELPAPLPLPAGGMASLRRRQRELALAVDAAVQRRIELTAVAPVIAEHACRLEDAASRQAADGAMRDHGDLVELCGWAPQTAVADLADLAARRGIAAHFTPPAANDEPPVLLRASGMATLGRDLVRFYALPGYRDWDVSVAVLMGFALFFAMALGDAGYAALLGLAVLLGWRRFRSPTARRLRRMLATLSAAALIWGVLVGCYFGQMPAADSLLSRLARLANGDPSAMMRLSLAVGAGHLVAANLGAAGRHWPQPAAFASLGWAVAIGTVSLAAFGALPWSFALPGAAAGVAAVVFTAGAIAPGGLLRRVAAGLLPLTLTVTALGDVLSYLRLFALAYAGTALATAVNELAQRSLGQSQGPGALLGPLILLAGHGINLVLGVAGGVVHGLRLNFIEFFRWALQGEGRPFQPLCASSRQWKTS